MTPAEPPIPPAAGDVAALIDCFDRKQNVMLHRQSVLMVDILIAGLLAEWRTTLEGRLAAETKAKDGYKQGLYDYVEQCGKLGLALAAAEAEAARLRAALKSAADEMEGVTVFVTSRERIKRPEGEDLWREAIRAARAASSESPSASGALNMER